MWKIRWHLLTAGSQLKKVACRMLTKEKRKVNQCNNVIMTSSFPHVEEVWEHYKHILSYKSKTATILQIWKIVLKELSQYLEQCLVGIQHIFLLLTHVDDLDTIIF